jgi:L-lactate utilization protein LutC
MSAARETFLETVRDAVQAGNQAGHAIALPERRGVGYQGAGSDLADRFAKELKNAGGQCYRVGSTQKAVEQVAALLHTLDAQTILLGRGEWIDTLPIAATLTEIGCRVWQESPGISRADAKESLFEADAGITEVDWLIAETGSIVLTSRPGQARSLSLLPPVHIAVAHQSQLIPDLFDLFEKCTANTLPANVTLVTGPSKTGDIELRLVTGVHGPGEVHVVLVE